MSKTTKYIQLLGDMGSVSYNKEQTLTDEQRAQARANISILNWRDVKNNNSTIKLADYSKIYYQNEDYTFDIDEAAQYMSTVSTNFSALGKIGLCARTLVRGLINSEILILSQMKSIVEEYEALKAEGIIGEVLCLCHADATENVELAYYITTSSISDYTHCLRILKNNVHITNDYVYYNKETSAYKNETRPYNIDKTLKENNMYADAKAVGDALALKADKTEIVQSDWSQNDETAVDYIKNKPTEEDALSLVTELNLVSPVAAEDGSIYTDENGAIYSL